MQTHDRGQAACQDSKVPPDTPAVLLCTVPHPPAGMSLMAHPAQENGMEFDFTSLEALFNLRASYAGGVRRNISPGVPIMANMTHIHHHYMVCL